MKLMQPEINIANDDGDIICKLKWEDEGVVTLSLTNNSIALDEQGIQEFPKLLEQGFKELMK